MVNPGSREALRIVFAGTAEFAVPSLQALYDAGHEIACVYTQPDRPAGRGRKLRASPVKCRALELNLSVRQPENLRQEATVAALAALKPRVMVVAAYGLILKREVLTIPEKGCINVHGSLLPRWRGAAPVQRAIEAGDARSGVSIMQMDEGVDTGPVYAQRACDILPEDTASDLHDRLAEMGAGLLIHVLDEIDRIRPRDQDESEACYARMLTKQEAEIDWQKDAGEIGRKIQAFNPVPGAYGFLEGDRVRLLRAMKIRGRTQDAPGTIIAAGVEGIDITAGQGMVRVLEIQWPGGKVLTAGEAAAGRSLAGKRFSVARPGAGRDRS